jgi:hypothetical protein
MRNGTTDPTDRGHARVAFRVRSRAAARFLVDAEVGDDHPGRSTPVVDGQRGGADGGEASIDAGLARDSTVAVMQAPPRPGRTDGGDLDRQRMQRNDVSCALRRHDSGDARHRQHSPLAMPPR